MKAITNHQYQLALAFVASALLLTGNAQAVQAWYLGSDGSGNLISESDGSGSVTWTGGGTVVNNVAVTGGSGSNNLIEGMTSGSLGGIVLSSPSVGTFFDVDITLIPAIPQTVATADFQILYHNTATLGSRGFNFTNLQNVSGIRVVTSYDQPLSANVGGTSARRAWGFAVANRLTDVNYNATLTLPDMITLRHDIVSSPPVGDPVLGTDYVHGTGPEGWFSGFDPSTTFAGVPAIMGLSTTAAILTGGTVPTYMNTADPALNEYLGIEGIDYNGDGDVMNHTNTWPPDELLARYSYLNTVDWLIESPDGSAFASGASFNFSMDGTVYNDTWPYAISATEILQEILAVPEPTSTALLGLGALALALRRRRG
jgi:hypothetical protein